MNKISVSVKGMHCKSCEILIEEKLLEIPEIRKCDTDYKRGLVEIFYSSQKPNKGEMEEAIRSAGYSLGDDDRKSFFSSNKNDYKDLGIAFLFVLGIFLLLKNFGIFNISLVSQSSSYGLSVVFLVGLTAGISSCMALIGGLVLGISARHREKHPEASPMQNFRPHLFFNLGRVVFFMILGGFLGLFGSFLEFSSLTLGISTIVVGVIMMFLGAKLLGVFPWLEKVNFTLPKKLSRIFGIKSHEKEYSHKNSFIAGGLTFFLPCGFTQAMQLYAVSTGSFFLGSVVMGLFALGTVPGLLGIGGLASAVKGIFARRFFKFAGIVVVLMAFFNLSNGYNLVSLGADYSSASASQKKQSVETKTDSVKSGQVQTIKMVSDNYGYAPKKLVVKKGLPVRWEIDVKDPYSCASSFFVPKLGLKKVLKAGINVIEFTPAQTGKIPFSCTMGMFNGVIEVVD